MRTGGRWWANGKCRNVTPMKPWRWWPCFHSSGDPGPVLRPNSSGKWSCRSNATTISSEWPSVVCGWQNTNVVLPHTPHWPQQLQLICKLLTCCSAPALLLKSINVFETLNLKFNPWPHHVHSISFQNFNLGNVRDKIQKQDTIVWFEVDGWLFKMWPQSHILHLAMYVLLFKNPGVECQTLIWQISVAVLSFSGWMSPLLSLRPWHGLAFAASCAVAFLRVFNVQLVHHLEHLLGRGRTTC